MRCSQHSTWSMCLLMLLGATGCTVGPKYRQPVVPVPPAYRGASDEVSAGSGPVLGDLQWSDVFTDPVLQKLLQRALVQNEDLALAATRIERARAQASLARLQDVPQVSGSFNYSEQRLSQQGLPADKVSGDPEGSAYIGNVSLHWEVDFWGRYRRLREAARARLLAAQDGQQAVRVSLVAAVAQAYYRLREYDAELLVVRESLDLRRQSLVLTEAREQGGVASLLDVRQAQTLVTEAEQTITALNRLLPQEENALRILLAEDPGPVVRSGVSQPDQVPQVRAGLPSSLLERRPDIRAAENQLRAANADIGAVRAEYFPSIGLTGGAGTESSAAHNLFTGGANTWFVQPSLNVPIFTGGVIHAREQEARAAEQNALQIYLGTVRQAFREVSDALIARQQTERFFAEQKLQVDHADSAAFLSRARYKGGVAGYLEVLETERTSLTSKLDLAQAEFNQLNASVQLYRALGGGWKP